MGRSDQGSTERFDDAHNLVVNMAVTIGLPAVIAFLCLLFIASRSAWKETLYKDPVSIWALSGLAGLLAASMFNPVSVAIWVLMAIILGIMTSYSTVVRPIGVKIKVAGYILAVMLIVFGTAFLASEILTQYGNKAYKLKDDKKANNLLKAAVTFNPLNTNARNYLIGSEINLKDEYEKASQDIERILLRHKYTSQNHKIAADLNYRMYVKSKEDRFKKRAVELYDRAIELEPNSAPLQASAGYASYLLGDYEKSINYLNKQIELSGGKDYPYSLIMKAKIHAQMNQKKEAVEAINIAQKLIADQPGLQQFASELEQSIDVSKVPFPFIFPELDI
jgi:hypothetical protein